MNEAHIEHQIALEQQQEYETRVIVMRLETYPFITFQNLHIKHAFKMFKGTRKEFDQLYNQCIKGHDNESKLPPVEILYTKQSQVDNVCGGVDRNILNCKPTETSKRNEANRYLKSGY